MRIIFHFRGLTICWPRTSLGLRDSAVQGRTFQWGCVCVLEPGRFCENMQEVPIPLA
jgi:hypothetical protein